MHRSRVFLALAAFSAVGVLAGQSVALGDTLPSGEVTFGKTVVEPAYDAANGNLIYLSTPMGTATHVNPNFAKNVAPIYLPVYPVGSYGGTLNCQDTTPPNTTPATTENCPDHGPEVAGAAMFGYPSIPNAPHAADVGAVYSNGVRGHDHLVGIASTGGDFNILWEPVLVLFTNPTAAQEHVTTLDQINELVASGDAVEFALPPATFHCSVVPAAVYNHGVPYTLG